MRVNGATEINDTKEFTVRGYTPGTIILCLIIQELFITRCPKDIIAV